MKEKVKDADLFFEKDIILLDGKCLYKGGKAYRVEASSVVRWLKRGATESIPHGVKVEKFANEIEAAKEKKEKPAAPAAITSINPADDSAPPEEEDSLESEEEIEESEQEEESVPRGRGNRRNKGTKNR